MELKPTTEQGAIEALWGASSRRELDAALRLREAGAAWYDFHERMRETHIRLAEEHERRALRLLDRGDTT